MNPRILHTYINRYYTERELLAEVRKNKKLIDIFNLKCVGINTKYVNTREKMNRKENLFAIKKKLNSIILSMKMLIDLIQKKLEVIIGEREKFLMS